MNKPFRIALVANIVVTMFCISASMVETDDVFSLQNEKVSVQHSDEIEKLEVRQEFNEGELDAQQDVSVTGPASIILLSEPIKTEQEKDTKPEWFRDVPLNEKIQKYMYEKCQEFDFDYDVLLALAWKESHYQTRLVSSTNDIGLLQINKNNQKWVNQMAGRELNLYDPYDNIFASLLILDSYRSEWIKQGIPEDKLMQYTLNSYNMGVTGYKRAGYPSRSYDRDIQRKADEIKNQK